MKTQTTKARYQLPAIIIFILTTLLLGPRSASVHAFTLPTRPPQTDYANS